MQCQILKVMYNHSDGYAATGKGKLTGKSNSRPRSTVMASRDKGLPSTACGVCRKKKKCSGTFPCTRCVKYAAELKVADPGSLCHFSTASSRAAQHAHAHRMFSLLLSQVGSLIGQQDVQQETIRKEAQQLPAATETARSAAPTPSRPRFGSSRSLVAVQTAAAASNPVTFVQQQHNQVEERMMQPPDMETTMAAFNLQRVSQKTQEGGWGAVIFARHDSSAARILAV